MRTLRAPALTLARALALTLAAWPGLAAADPLPAQATRTADYRISVKLDTVTKQLAGTASITWRNPSSDQVGDLWFHLYLNAFRNSNSTFFRESRGHRRGDRMVPDAWGWLDITGMTLDGGIDLKPAIRFEAPDDGNKDDRTVVRVPLPKPVGPGESITLQVKFDAQLPQVFARTGYIGDYFLVGQWYPKLGVYEPAGTRGRTTGGWNCRQFHGLTEFYADFGSYDVEITLPNDFIVGATGERVERRDNRNGTATHKYRQENVHDFAWTAYPRFVEVRRKFVASREVTPVEYAEAARLLDRPEEELRLTDVDLILLMQPSHLPQVERHVRAATLALKWFGLWYGRYPHKTLTLVDPVDGEGGSGGMEYPTFVTLGTSARLNGWPFNGVRWPEVVTVHEIAHQYFQGMIASNEFEEAWLDEGIASYGSGRALELAFGRDATLADFFGFRFSERDYIRLAYGPDAKYNAVNQLPWTYDSDYSYGVNAYVRPELTLRSLENHVGRQTMARIMRTYAERWRFRHPGTQDFYAVANEVSGRDVAAQMAQVIDQGRVLDFEIGSVSSVRAMPPSGLLDGPKGRTFVSQADAEKQRDAPDAAAKGDAMYDTKVIVRRRGEAIVPVEIAFKFAGVPVERQTWDGQTRWRAFTFHRREALEWVDIDPDRKNELDVDWLNNTRRLDPDRRAAVRLTSRWTFFLQQMFALLGL
jgi:hypothetical protein